MPLDAKFFEAVKPLLVPGMGTEHVGLLLYSLVRMTRPRNLLEVGVGFTTPFLAMALHDNVRESGEDSAILAKSKSMRSPDEISRRGILDREFFKKKYTPFLHAIDDFSLEHTAAPRVLEAIKELGLEQFIKVQNSDFRGLAANMEPSFLPLDLVWFDCGNAIDYREFISEYWPFINPHHGLLLLHFTYWPGKVVSNGIEREVTTVGSVLNEFKRQQVMHGMHAKFEVLSLLEPHKSRQGSVTMIRKLPGGAYAIRHKSFEKEMEGRYGKMVKPFPEL